MNTPSLAEIALPASRHAVEEMLHKRVQEAIARVSKEFIYEAVCAAMLQRIMYRMCQEMGRIVTDLGLPKTIETFYEDADHGGKILLFAYEGRVIGKAYLTP